MISTTRHDRKHYNSYSCMQPLVDLLSVWSSGSIRFNCFWSLAYEKLNRAGYMNLTGYVWHGKVNVIEFWSVAVNMLIRSAEADMCVFEREKKNSHCHNLLNVNSKKKQIPARKPHRVAMETYRLYIHPECRRILKGLIDSIDDDDKIKKLH